MTQKDDLISRSALMEELSTLTMTITGFRAGENVLREFLTEYRKSVLRIVDEAPAVDPEEIFKSIPCVKEVLKMAKQTLAPVVRCEDCAVPHNRWTGCPNLNGLIPPDDFFCARGERRK